MIFGQMRLKETPDKMHTTLSQNLAQDVIAGLTLWKNIWEKMHVLVAKIMVFSVAILNINGVSPKLMKEKFKKDVLAFQIMKIHYLLLEDHVILITSH